MKQVLLIFFVLGSLFVSAGITKADMAIPTTTTVYFEKDGKPFSEPVDFTVNCYGYNTGIPPVEKQPGNYTPENVYSFSASCPKYGCEIKENYYLNYRHIDYCNLSGKAGGQDFKIEKYGTSPVIFSDCSNEGLARKCTLKFEIPTTVKSAEPLKRDVVSQPPKESFWKVFFHSIDCFFKGLFGVSCQK